MSDFFADSKIISVCKNKHLVLLTFSPQDAVDFVEDGEIPTRFRAKIWLTYRSYVGIIHHITKHQKRYPQMWYSTPSEDRILQFCIFYLTKKFPFFSHFITQNIL